MVFCGGVFCGGVLWWCFFLGINFVFRSGGCFSTTTTTTTTTTTSRKRCGGERSHP